jgi:hypothetical protein
MIPADRLSPSKFPAPRFAHLDCWFSDHRFAFGPLSARTTVIRRMRGVSTSAFAGSQVSYHRQHIEHRLFTERVPNQKRLGPFIVPLKLQRHRDSGRS